MDGITDLGRSNSYLQANSLSSRLHSRAAQVMPAGSTRASVYTYPYPPYAAYGHGCRFVDAEGVERLDFHNNYTALILGHANPAVVRAVTEQLESGFSYSMPTEAEIVLAEEINSRLRSAERIRFANSGTEAMMVALKAARAFTGRQGIAKFEGAFHGAYDFVEVSLAPDPTEAGPIHSPCSVARDDGVAKTALQDVVVLPWNDPDTSATLILENQRDLAAVIVDPMPNYAGLIPPRPGFLQAIREVTAENGILLIFDEVLNFRLGYNGAQGRFGIQPDLTVLGKIIGGGFPVGAVAGATKIMDVFSPVDGKPRVYHSGTATANPITMVAGKTTLRQLDLEAFGRLETLGDRLREEARAIIEEEDFPGQVTGLGSNFRLHLTKNELMDYRSTLLDPRQKAMKEALYFALLAKGIMIAPSGMGCLSTPMGDEEIDRFLSALHDSIKDLKDDYL